VAAIGCGGSAGPSGPVTPVATYRKNAPGDAWNFNVTLSINGGTLGTYKGTLEEAMANDEYNGAASVRYDRIFHLQLQTGPATLTGSVQLSPDGGLLAEYLNGAYVNVVSDTLSIPSTLAVGVQASGRITLENGMTFDETFSVVDKQRVVTGAGTFDCWVVNENVAASTGTVDTFKLWIAPQTGNYVQFTDTTVNADNSDYTYNANLTSLVTARGSLGTIKPSALPFVLGRGR